MTQSQSMDPFIKNIKDAMIDSLTRVIDDTHKEIKEMVESVDRCASSSEEIADRQEDLRNAIAFREQVREVYFEVVLSFVDGRDIKLATDQKTGILCVKWGVRRNRISALTMGRRERNGTIYRPIHQDPRGH